MHEQKQGHNNSSVSEFGIVPRSESNGESSYAGADELVSIGELLKKAFEIFKSIIGRYIGLMFIPFLFALPLLAILLVAGILNYATTANMIEGGGLMDSGVVGIGLIILVLAGLAVIVAAGIIAQAAIFLLVANYPRTPGAWAIFKKARTVAWRVFLINLIMGAFIMLWGFLLIIPGIIAAVYYSFSVWVFLSEGYEGTSALKRSKELVKGRWWQLFARLALPYLFVLLFSTLPNLLIREPAFQAVWSLVWYIASFAFGAFFLSYTYLIYQDFARTAGPSKIENKKNNPLVYVFIVLAFAGLIALFAFLPMLLLNSARDKAVDTRLLSDLKQIEVALELYSVGKPAPAYPVDLEELISGPYMLYVDMDALEEYGLSYESDGRSYELCFFLEKPVGNYAVGENCLKGRISEYDRSSSGQVPSPARGINDAPAVNSQVNEGIVGIQIEEPNVPTDPSKELSGIDASAPTAIDLDSDGDGLTDIEEKTYGTNKYDPDTDKDGYSDGDEIKSGFNPNGPGTLR